MNDLMDDTARGIGRRAMLLSVAAVALMPVIARAKGLGIGGLLGGASDNALDKLSKPGAFYADQAVRILLPGPLKKATSLLKLTDKAGLTNGLVKSLNDAAGMAAGEAKPIFRTAISRISLTDGIDIARQKDGGTRYLRQSAGSELRDKLRPLILTALGKTGAFRQLDAIGSAGGGLLGSLGVSRDGLTDSVTDQALSGIFTYMGAEEARLRANPLGILQGIGRN